MRDNEEGGIIRYTNCRLFRNGKLYELNERDLWTENGRVIDSFSTFYSRRRAPSRTVDCNGLILAPGFIDLQVNGGWGIDFSTAPSSLDDYEAGIRQVARRLIEHGVTAFAPTLITSDETVYHRCLPIINRVRHQPRDGEARIVGIHFEGPFISPKRSGCHPLKHVKDFGLNSKMKTADDIIKTIFSVYVGGECDISDKGLFLKRGIAIITLAPELLLLQDSTGITDYCLMHEVIGRLTKKYGVVVSVGHSDADVEVGERAVLAGASLVTHLFNAMRSFHHRDPGLLGLLASDKLRDAMEQRVKFKEAALRRMMSIDRVECALREDCIAPVFASIISDGVHTHPASVRVAQRTLPEGIILVSDSISAAGLSVGEYTLGARDVIVRHGENSYNGVSPHVPYVKVSESEEVLAGSATTLDVCLVLFHHFAKCSVEAALRTVTTHPWAVLDVNGSVKGNGVPENCLCPDQLADFVLIDSDTLRIKETFLTSRSVFKLPSESCD